MKQKLLTILLLIACVGNAWGIRYKVNTAAGTAEVVSSTASYSYDDAQNYSGNVIIPEKITWKGNDYIVKKIAYDAFKGKSVASVVIPESVTLIEYSAFENCSNLGSVNIPSGVKEIGWYAFKNCRSLKSIEIPSGLKEIGNQLFYGCSGLTSLSIPSGVISIGEDAFYNCSNIASLTWGSSSCSPYAVALYCSDNLKEVILLDGLTSIRSRAFSGCYRLTSITIPESVTLIEYSAFENCSNLGSVNIPSGVTEIGWYAFKNCSSLKSIEIPSGLKEIGKQLFYGCSGLTSLSIPSNVTSILEEAFWGCSNIASLTWGSSSCSPYAVTQYCNAKLKEVTLLDGLTSIGDNTFYGCTGLTSITIPEGVTRISYRAFCYCSGLTSITIPESVTSIGDRAFDGISNMTVYVSNVNAPTVGKEFLANATVYVPNVTAFMNYGRAGWGNSLKNRLICQEDMSDGDIITVNNKTAGQLSSRILQKGVQLNEVIAIKITGNLDATDWGIIKNELNLYYIDLSEAKITDVPAEVFKGKLVKTVKLPESITSIGNDAFRGCSQLEGDYTFSGDVKIGIYAFSGTRIHDITFGGTANVGENTFSGSTINEAIFDGDATIGTSAFANTPIAKVTFGGTANVGQNAFSGTKINEVTFGGDATIGESPFANTPIAKVTFGGTANVGQNAFSGTKINEVTFGGDATIGTSAFKNTPLQGVSFPGNVKIGSSAFEGSSLASADFGGTVEVGESAFLNSKLAGTLHIDAMFRSVGNKAFSGTQIEKLIVDEGAYKKFVSNRNTPLITNSRQLSSPYSDKDEGNLAALIDGNTSTFWHSDWHHGKPGHGNHYLQVKDIDTSVESVCLYLRRRDISTNQITKMSVYGFDSNQSDASKSNGVLLAVLNLPSNQVEIVSAAFQTKGKPVLRFYEEAAWSLNEGSNGYWHAAEIQLYPFYYSSPESCFANCVNLKEVVFNENLDMLGNSIFSGCSSLTTIKWPTGLKVLGTSSFAGTGFTELELPDGLTSIDTGVFDNCKSLETLDVPASVTTWNGTNKIAGCDNLKVLSVHWNKPLAVGTAAFNKVDCTKVQLWIPFFTSSSYLNADGWKDFNRNIYERYGTVTVTAGKGGSVEVHGQTVTEQTKDVQLISGMEMVFTITPKAGYMIESVFLDGEDVTEDAEGSVYGMTYTIEEIDDDYTLEVTFVESAEQEVPVFVSAKNRYDTLIVPFDTELPAGLKAYTVDGADDTNLTLTDASSIQAHTAYVIENTTAQDIDTTIKGIVVKGNEQGNTTGMLTGVYTQTEAPVGCYVLQNHDGVVAFYRVDGGLTSSLYVDANRCYLNMGSDSSEVKAFYLDGQATGIENLEMAADKTVIYDLSGRRVSKVQKGLYIVNGKKVMK